MTNTEVVKEYLDCYNHIDKTKVATGECQSCTRAMGLLDENYKFIGPMMTTEGREAFLKGMEPMIPIVEGIDLIGTAENGDWVAAIFTWKASIPGLEETPTTEWFKVVNGKIVESRLFFDATKWRQVMAQQGA